MPASCIWWGRDTAYAVNCYMLSQESGESWTPIILPGLGLYLTPPGFGSPLAAEFKDFFIYAPQITDSYRSFHRIHSLQVRKRMSITQA